MTRRKNTLEIDSVVFGFIFGKHIITDCYIHCETGEIIGLLGRNGSGKSTLFKIIFGTVHTPNKFIRINDIPCKRPYEKKK